MKPHTVTSVGLSLVLLAPLLGCSAGVGEPALSQSRVVESSDAEEVLASAREILEREFGEVTVDPVHKTLTSTPLEYPTQRASGTARDLIGAPSRMRRIARFHLAPRGEKIAAYLRVDIERWDTEQYRLVRLESTRFSDVPDSTPIDEDAATTQEQNMVWTPVKRDYALERKLLEELRDRFAPAPEVEPSRSEASY